MFYCPIRHSKGFGFYGKKSDWLDFLKRIRIFALWKKHNHTPTP